MGKHLSLQMMPPVRSGYHPGLEQQRPCYPGVRPTGRPGRSGPVGRRVRRNRHKLVAAAAAHGITRLRVFGSVARGDDRPDSDLDLLADLPPGLSMFGLGRVEAELEDIVSARVDLAPAE